MTGAAVRPSPAVTPSPTSLWDLDPTATFLNHGSFGACPSAVLQRQSEWRARMERQPVQFFARDLDDALGTARQRLAELVHADAGDLAFVTNATQGVNTVLASLELQPGDEMLTTDHAYNACRCALQHFANRRGARLVVAQVPFPLRDPSEVSERVLAAVTPRTRLALLDHVTSPTGLVMPIEVMVPALQERRVRVLVDGAHAPGMLPLDLTALGADYYTGNLHKWLCAPKGSALLHVRRDRQEGLHPLSISHGWDAPRGDRSRFQVEFGWGGTDDPTGWLCVPECIDVLTSLGGAGGLQGHMAANRSLALQAREVLCATLAIAKPAPDTMIGSLAAVPLPDGLGPADDPGRPWSDALHDLLWRDHRIEVPVFPWPQPGRRVLRVSAQAYNRLSDYERLAGVLASLPRLRPGTCDISP
jgi:isopenicillin-N epimerase